MIPLQQQVLPQQRITEIRIQTRAQRRVGRRQNSDDFEFQELPQIKKRQKKSKKNEEQSSQEQESQNQSSKGSKKGSLNDLKNGDNQQISGVHKEILDSQVITPFAREFQKSIFKLKSKKIQPDNSQYEKWNKRVMKFSKLYSSKYFPFEIDQSSLNKSPNQPLNKKLSSDLVALSSALVNLDHNISKIWINLQKIQKKDSIHTKAIDLLIQAIENCEKHRFSLVFQLGQSSFQKYNTISSQNTDNKQSTNEESIFQFFDTLHGLKNIQTLGLIIGRDITINDEQLNTIINCVKGLQNLQSVRIQLDYNAKVTFKGYQKIWKLIKESPNLLKVSIKFSDIRDYNDNENKYLNEMLQSLKGQNKTLITVQFKQYHFITLKEIQFLMEVINSIHYLKNFQFEIDQMRYKEGQQQLITDYIEKEIDNRLRNNCFFLSLDSKHLIVSQKLKTRMLLKKMNFKTNFVKQQIFKKVGLMKKFRQEVIWEIFEFTKILKL